MPSDVQITAPVARVLRAFLDDVGRPRYGFELMRITGLPSGTVYPILARLESAGWLASHRESVSPTLEGRPARRLYLISADGARAAHLELAALSEQLRPPRAPLRRLSPQGGAQ